MLSLSVCVYVDGIGGDATEEHVFYISAFLFWCNQFLHEIH